MADNTLVAVDLAKTVFQVAFSKHPGPVSKDRRLGRTQFAEFLAQMPPATIVMEACGSAHFWARRMLDLGHTPILLPAHAVRPYVPRNKTDRADAKGMLVAHRNEEIRSVPVKTVAQQALCSLHRIRAGWITERTAARRHLRAG